jgi:hypothetical protein
MLELRITILLGCALSVACGGSVTLPNDDDRKDDGSEEGSPRTVATFFSLVHVDNSLCLPQRLSRGPDGAVTCRMVEALADKAGTCSAHAGLVDADPQIAAAFRGTASLIAEHPVCELVQLAPAAGESCASSATAGWCYVDGAAAGTACQQALRFSPRGLPSPGVLVGIGCAVERLRP